MKADQVEGTLQTIVSIVVYDQQGNSLGEFGRQEIQGSFDWTRFSETITNLPDTAYRAHVKIAVKETNGAGKAYFDAIQLGTLKLKVSQIFHKCEYTKYSVNIHVFYLHKITQSYTKLHKW